MVGMGVRGVSLEETFCGGGISYDQDEHVDSSSFLEFWSFMY